MVNELIAISANLIFDCIVLLIIFKFINPKSNQKDVYPIKPGLTLFLSVIIYVLSVSVLLFSTQVNFSKRYDGVEVLAFIIKSVIIAPVFEEILFRKVVLNRILETNAGKSTAIVITSILFTCTHFIYVHPTFKVYSLLYVFIFSLLISDLFIRTNNLKLVIFIHAITNLIGFFTPKIMFYSKDLDSSTRVCIFISIVLLFGLVHRFLLGKYVSIDK